MKNSTRGFSTIELLTSLVITGIVVGGVLSATGVLNSAAQNQTVSVTERASLMSVTRTLLVDGWQLIDVDGYGATARLTYIDPTPRQAGPGELSATLSGGELHITGAAQNLDLFVAGSACSPVTTYAAKVLQLSHEGAQLALKTNLGSSTQLLTGVSGMNAASNAQGLNLALQAAGPDGRTQTISTVYLLQPYTPPACPPVVAQVHVTERVYPTSNTDLGTPVTVTQEPEEPKKKKPRYYADADGNLISAADWNQLPADERGYRNSTTPCNGTCTVQPAPISGGPVDEADDLTRR
ncbi:prepilin-type N-terminal cleavage/methylation domain-containing protein [Deinococcus arenicola]|uniref:Prepilin-type N-terminal cleavage/methylation domain-containing protein n=1 Tax=Deinococcus arenicola TaxID=2994950 RepID=A0ABU4DWU2_9DEIO|nr:prepilin-type N-terminal cleavage/methylation domain-containing protein [Deinococcus sp. ZS9-10]MDV6376144.1 prepilin-type N-terminal cleavage/methylation domain-containing protein [Deinococcus sp. ZS9-10]